MFIEINLLDPGRRARRQGLPIRDRASSLIKRGGPATAVSFIAIALVCLAGFGYWNSGERIETLDAAIRAELADSATIKSVVDQIESQAAAELEIVERIDFVREAESRKYVWPRLLKEIAFALPEGAWLLEMGAAAPADTAMSGPGLSIEGRAGGADALTRFIRNLEDSPHIASVTLISTAQETFDDRPVQRFSLAGRFQRTGSFEAPANSGAADP